jgi:hypothetical protein
MAKIELFESWIGATEAGRLAPVAQRRRERDADQQALR